MRAATEGGAPTGSVMSEREFAFFASAVREHAGIAMGPAKRAMLSGRLHKVMQREGIDTFANYAQRIARAESADVREFVDAVTTNLTSFFREPHHFEFLRSAALPELLARQGAGRIRIWSAGCSSGEEAYSIAVVLHQALAGRECDAKVLASDIDDTCLQRAGRAIYPLDRLDDIPEEYRRLGFQRGSGTMQGMMRVRPEVAGRVSVRRVNLMEPWPMRSAYDIIFCRNVAIYFDKPTQRQLVDRFADLLNPNGLLFIGHSETLFQVSDRFAPLGRTIYRKLS